MPIKFIVLLDTMWGTHGTAPNWFQINPRNHSGARLYRLTRTVPGELLVGNACSQQTSHARLHGTPSVKWLQESWRLLTARQRALPLLVCGNVAREAYAQLLHTPHYRHSGPVHYMMHPAARTWSKEKLLITKWEIAGLCR